ncbi:MAG: DNA polymerase III subunit delta [Porticoccaceae bacterium UBA1117]|jgi:DNA polymerase-3 subunit delta|nr:DNA polymerase III subunit delta [Porticoccaceae bacterium]CAI8275363.1 MAG: DNA polymerase III subunit delta [Porticoccaceae bacterium UBA1117]|tara:strand:+ start:2239 stop:3285 length:1047 start_codon:yes stop_codon:yes gene_type:complete
MKIRPEQLQSHLSKELLAVYVISGDEPLLAQESADAVRLAARNKGFSGREVFHGEGKFDWGQLHNEANALSLFTEKKIIEVRISNGKPGDKGSKAICELCTNPNPDNLLLVILPKLERAAQNSKWVKALESSGAHIQVWPITGEQLPRWIKQRLLESNITANQQAVEILAERVEGNLLAAVQEIEKLKLLAIDGKVDAIMMSSVVADSARYNLFEFVDKVLAGDAQSAARSLRGLHSEGTDAIPLLWAITRELRILIKASEQISQGESRDRALKNAGVWEKRLPLFRTAIQRCSAPHLRMLLYQAGAIDRGIKGMRKADVWDELTTLVLSLAGSQTLKPSNIKLLIGP